MGELVVEVCVVHQLAAAMRLQATLSERVDATEQRAIALQAELAALQRLKAEQGEKGAKPRDG